MNAKLLGAERLSPALGETGRVLARSDLVRDYCASFARLSRVGLRLLPVAAGEGVALARESDLGPALVASVPVRMGRVTVAWFQLEPVRWFEPAWEAGGAIEVVMRRVRTEPGQRLRRIDGAQYAAWLRLLAIFARQLGERGNALAVREAEARHPLVRRMSEFIGLHAGEEIMLRRAAAVTGFSTFYFCKLFHRVAGMGFSEYLARLRVERAKAMLLDPHTRVNEAAFRAGFQSLSQFNRAFRRITGEAPSAHRMRFAVASASASRPEGWRIAA